MHKEEKMWQIEIWPPDFILDKTQRPQETTNSEIVREEHCGSVKMLAHAVPFWTGPQEQEDNDKDRQKWGGKTNACGYS